MTLFNLENPKKLRKLLVYFVPSQDYIKSNHDLPIGN